MKNRKYVLVPGWILNDDGKSHSYVGAKDLLDMYSVDEDECVVSVKGTNEHIKELIDCGLTALTPRGTEWAARKDQDLKETSL